LIFGFLFFFAFAISLPGILAGEDKSTKKFPATAESTIKLALMSTSSVPMMAMFLLLDEFWATSEPKSLGASQHPDEGVCQFGSLILAMSQRSDALFGHIHIADYLPFISNAKKIWCVASRRAALSSPGRVSWLSHRLLSSSHCATLLSSHFASLLLHRFSSSSC
jgi:hypothetical protein